MEVLLEEAVVGAVICVASSNGPVMRDLQREKWKLGDK